MSIKVFLSYRRDDSAYAARGVHDRLEREFGRESIFMDVDGIPFGVDFVEMIGVEVAKCDVLLALIGPNWLDARDHDGTRRLDSAHDFVRIEVAAALKRNIPVIPILLEGTRVPKAEHLPDDLEALSRRNGLDVSHASFHNDLDRLVRALRGTIAAPAAPTMDRSVHPSTAVSHPVGLAPAGLGKDNRTDEVPLPAGSGEPIVPAERRVPAAKRRAARLLIGAGLLSVSAILGILIYVDRSGKPDPTAASDAGPAPTAPSRPLAAKPGLVVPAAPSSKAGLEMQQPADPAPEFTDCEKSCPVMIVVPAGSFIMGSPKTEVGRDKDEGPQHEVTIAVPFAVAKFEVTFDEWDACTAASACPSVEDERGRGRLPVINVTWDDAQQYARWLSRVTGKAYRLLTEAEWEYAARAGTTTRYSWGDDPGTGKANCRGCDGQWHYRWTMRVGSFEPNAFGLHDMHGNVWEWVEDASNDTYIGAPTEGSAWLRALDPSIRVVRGGSYADVADFLRAAVRGKGRMDDRSTTIGLRVARTLTP